MVFLPILATNILLLFWLVLTILVQKLQMLRVVGFLFFFLSHFFLLKFHQFLSFHSHSHLKIFPSGREAVRKLLESNLEGLLNLICTPSEIKNKGTETTTGGRGATSTLRELPCMCLVGLGAHRVLF